jgi:hypothetical protein
MIHLVYVVSLVAQWHRVYTVMQQMDAVRRYPFQTVLRLMGPPVMNCLAHVVKKLATLILVLFATLQSATGRVGNTNLVHLDTHVCSMGNVMV